jgi:nicotinamidase/pyrazinamidase
MRNNILFIIDGQNDFLALRDGVPYSETGQSGMRIASLPVPGGVEDLERLAAFIDSDARGERIDQIVFTLDTHEPAAGDRHVGHSKYWVNSKGLHPDPFTLISPECMETGRWMPYENSLCSLAHAYLMKVGRQMIWPEHCISGTWGNSLYAPLMAAIRRWESRSGKSAHVLRKGMYNHSEQYGVFEAAVPNPACSRTLYNHSLLNMLKAGTTVYVGGEALLHCVASSLRQAFSHLTPGEIQKWTLLVDCTSPVQVGNYEADSAAFIEEMKALGMKTAIAAP